MSNQPSKLPEQEIRDALDMMGTGYETIRVKDSSNDRKYFTITPRIVKSFSRNSHDFAVWDTIKDIAGESGECILNTDQIAILSGCSTGQVSSSRKYWLKLGFLKGEIRKDEGFSQAVWHLRVPDIWQKNVEWCEKYPKIADRLAFRLAHKSLHTVKPSYSEGKPSPSETKKNIIQKNAEDIKRATASLAKLYEGNIGALTPMIADFLRNAAIDYPEEWFEPAFKVAVSNNARSWTYVETVLENWKKHHFGWKPEGSNNGHKNGSKARPGGAGRQAGPPADPTPADLELAREIKAGRNGSRV